MAFLRNKAVYSMCVAHSLAVFCLGLVLFVAKWFPYGTSIRWLREWLYRFF